MWYSLVYYNTVVLLLYDMMIDRQIVFLKIVCYNYFTETL